MSDQFLGEVRPFACTFAPAGWALCQGQILPIQQNTALFSLLGTFYGGNGTSTFALPDLRGRVPMKYGTDPVGNVYSIGEIAGEETVTLNGQQMPVHNHTFSGIGTPAGRQKPNNNAALGSSQNGEAFYAASNASGLGPINAGTISIYNGGSQAHTNIQPYQVINWCIALRGVFPARN